MTAPAIKGQPRTCLVCGAELRPPALHFDRAECVAEWIRAARARDGGIEGPVTGHRRTQPDTLKKGRPWHNWHSVKKRAAR